MVKFCFRYEIYGYEIYGRLTRFMGVYEIYGRVYEIYGSLRDLWELRDLWGVQGGALIFSLEEQNFTQTPPEALFCSG